MMNKLFPIILFPITLLRLLGIVVISVDTFIRIKCIPKRNNTPYHIQNNQQKRWAKICLSILGFKVNVKGSVPEGTFIIMPNHRSYVDIFAISAYCPSSFVAKAELEKWPVIGDLVKQINLITVNRSKLSALKITAEKIEKNVLNGNTVTVFPEGTIYSGPQTKVFKKGTFKMAAIHLVPIIPVSLSYSNKEITWMHKEYFTVNFFKQMWRPKQTLTITIGEPVVSNNFLTLIQDVKATIDYALK